jgi:hypothetical protein
MPTGDVFDTLSGRVSPTEQLRLLGTGAVTPEETQTGLGLSQREMGVRPDGSVCGYCEGEEAPTLDGLLEKFIAEGMSPQEALAAVQQTATFKIALAIQEKARAASANTAQAIQEEMLQAIQGQDQDQDQDQDQGLEDQMDEPVEGEEEEDELHPDLNRYPENEQPVRYSRKEFAVNVENVSISTLRKMRRERDEMLRRHGAI